MKPNLVKLLNYFLIICFLVEVSYMATGGDVDGSWMKVMSLQHLAFQKDFKASAHWSLTLTLI